MAIKKTNREQKAEQQRICIVEAGKALFFEYGFDRVTVDDVCAQAGVSKSTFYSHFNSKQDLLMLFSSQKRREFLKEQYTYDPDKPLKELFRAFFFANFSYNKLLPRTWFRDSYVSYIKAFRQEQLTNHYYQDELRRLIARGIEEDAFRASLSAEEHFHMIHDWIIGFFIGHCIFPDNAIGVDQAYDKIMNAMVDALLK